jgi:hypothetical protein
MQRRSEAALPKRHPPETPTAYADAIQIGSTRITNVKQLRELGIEPVKHPFFRVLWETSLWGVDVETTMQRAGFPHCRHADGTWHVSIP